MKQLIAFFILSIIASASPAQTCPSCKRVDEVEAQILKAKLCPGLGDHTEKQEAFVASGNLVLGNLLKEKNFQEMHAQKAFRLLRLLFPYDTDMTIPSFHRAAFKKIYDRPESPLKKAAELLDEVRRQQLLEYIGAVPSKDYLDKPEACQSDSIAEFFSMQYKPAK